MSDPLLPARVRKALGSVRIGGTVHYRATVGSTNEWARQLGQDGEPDGTLVLADEQTAGRGRRRRRWVSPPGKGIYASVLLVPPASSLDAGAAVQLAAGIAIAESVASLLPHPPALRWPNDCYCAAAKLAGVLVEVGMTGDGTDFLVCGMGINVNHVAEDFPAELRDRATSLRLLAGHDMPRLPLLVEILQSLERWDDIGRLHGMAPVRDRWLELSPESRGGRVEVLTERGRLEGTAEGLSEGGGLLVRDGDTVHEVTVGEVVRLTPSG